MIGGHSVEDDEIKFGYAVTGTVHPERIKANAGARVGDVLMLTKRIGTGVIATALKRGIAASNRTWQPPLNPCCRSIARLAKRCLQFDVHGCTDVTGFGLLGHAREMALGSGVTLEIDAAARALLPGAVEYARQGAIPGGLKNNREFVAVRGAWKALTSGSCDYLALRSADFRWPADPVSGTRMPTSGPLRFPARLPHRPGCARRRKPIHVI